MILVVNPLYTQLRTFVESMPTEFENGGEIIYNARNQIRVFTLPNGQQINVKRYQKPIFINRLIYSFVRTAKAKRAYQYALQLAALNIPTPTPIAYILQQKCGLLQQSYLITLQSPLRHTFYEFGKGTLNDRENIVRDMARFTAGLHDQGVYHKDYSPGNILFDIAPDGHTDFTVVDINRMEFGQHIDLEKGCANFARLWGNRHFFEILAKTYAECRHFDEQTCLERMLHYREKFWSHHDKTLYNYD